VLFLATKNENVEIISMLTMTLHELLLSMKSKCALVFTIDSSDDALISSWTGSIIIRPGLVGNITDAEVK